jgi:GntR family transcriptional regulator, transcriptional repressor for pyruvate dehydrogenase complex
MLEFRLMLEGTTSYLSAIRATDDDLARMQALIDALCDAHRAGDSVREAQIDGEFHSALADASHNTMFRHLRGSFTRMLSEHISLNNAGLETLREEMSTRILAQHLALWDAIRNRRADDARRLMREHIAFVWQQLEPDTPVTNV